MDDAGLHPGHKSIRLKGHDYSAPAVYFLTFCAERRRSLFGRVLAGKVEFTPMGRIARETWVAIPSHFANVKLHDFVVMPNHVHGIIEIVETVGQQRKSAKLETSLVGAQHAAPLRARIEHREKRVVERGSLSAIVRSYKAAVTLRARRELKWTKEVWQRNYFERFLRDGKEFDGAARYIAENPMKWDWDRENPKAKHVQRETSAAGTQHAAPPWGL